MYRLSASEAYSKWHYLNWSIIIIIIIIDIQQSVDQAKTKKAYHLIKKIKKKYVPRTSWTKYKTDYLLSVKQDGQSIVNNFTVTMDYMMKKSVMSYKKYHLHQY